MSGRVEPGSWQDRAWRAIDCVHATLPADISFADRKKAIDAAYPFQWRKMHPYKMWLKARKAYLARYDDKPAGPLDVRALSPLERQKQRAERIARHRTSPSVRGCA